MDTTSGPGDSGRPARFKVNREKTPEWTDKERAFVEALSRSGDCIEAAREAGYSDPRGEIDRLMARPHVSKAAFSAMRKAYRTTVFQWRELIEDAKRVFAIGMRMGDLNAAIKAASKVMDTIAKVDDRSLVDKAAKEDTDTSRDELAQAVLAQRNESGAPALVYVEPKSDKDN